MPNGPRRYQAMLFELEGVLVDTAPLRSSALQRALSAEGLTVSPHDLHDLRSVLPASRRDGARRTRFLQLDDTALELIALRAEREFDTSLAGAISLAPGARLLIEALAGRVRLAVVTRLLRRQASAIIEAAAFEPMFELIVAAEDAEPKPSGAPYDEAIARLARRAPLQRDRVLAVEDSATGIMAAARAGVDCVVVGDIPAHEALTACGYIPSLAGITPEELERVASDHDAGASR